MEGQETPSAPQPPSPESHSNNTQRIKTLDARHRLLRMAKDPRCQQGTMAGLRAIINGGITVGDVFPGVGDAVSWVADMLKVTSRTARRLGVTEKITRLLDTTPDVSLIKALGSEGLEAVSFGFFPSHGIETTYQLKYDYPRIKEGFTRGLEIWREREIAEQEDYVENKGNIDLAMDQFRTIE